MPFIKVNTQGVVGLCSSVRSIKNKNAECYSNLSRVKNNLQWQVQARSNINGRISSLQRKINKQETKLNAYIRALQSASDAFCEKDRQLSRETKNIIYGLKACQYAAMNVGKVKKARSTRCAWLLNRIGEINSIFSLKNTRAVSLGLIKAGADFIYTNAQKKAEEVVLKVGRGVQKAKNAVSAFKSRFEEGGDLYTAGLYIKSGIKLVGGIAKVAGSIATIAGTAGGSAPLAVFGVVYGANDIMNSVNDIINIAKGNTEEVGKKNYLRETLVSGYGEAGRLLGNENAGRIVGEVLYGTGNICSIASGVDQLVNGYTKISNAVDKAIQVDGVSFRGLVSEARTIPSKLWEFGKTNVGTGELAYQFKLFTYEIPNTVKTVQGIKTFTDILATTQKVAKAPEKIYNNAKKIYDNVLESVRFQDEKISASHARYGGGGFGGGRGAF